MNKKDNKKYYILKLSGYILISISILIFVITISLMNIYPLNQLIGWICFFMFILAFLIFIFAIYLLKKANYIKFYINDVE